MIRSGERRGSTIHHNGTATKLCFSMPKIITIKYAKINFVMFYGYRPYSFPMINSIFYKEVHTNLP